jgi:diguanylate cyclase (GGDEF)-like protein
VRAAVATPLSLLMIDIDHFKPYNDHYGHQKGDQCLIRVAATLAAMLKRPCDLMARYGGEEFGIILPDTDLPQAQRMAEAIRAAVQELAIPHGRHSNAEHVTVSIGIATQDVDTQPDIEMLIGAPTARCTRPSIRVATAASAAAHRTVDDRTDSPAHLFYAASPSYRGRVLATGRQSGADPP